MARPLGVSPASLPDVGFGAMSRGPADAVTARMIGGREHAESSLCTFRPL
jgi:hypothetical protein